MKKLLGLLLLSTFVQAASITANYDQMFLLANAERNYTLNSGAEKNDAGVTDSSSIHSRSTSSPLIGVASHLIDASGSAQNVDFSVTSLESGLLGTNCEALFLLSGDASLYTATVRINSADVTTAQTLPNTGSYSQAVSIPFPCGISGVSPVLRISSTSASAAAIKLDTIYFGKAVSLGTVNQIGDWQTYTPTVSGFGTATATGKWVRIGGDLLGRVTVTISNAAGAGSLNFSIPTNLAIDYSRTSTSTFARVGQANASNTGTGATYTGAILTNGTSATQLLAYGDNGATQWTSTVPLTLATTTQYDFIFQVPIVGWTTTSSYSLMNTYWKVDANISGADPSLGTSDVTDYASGVLESGSLTLTNNSGTGNIAAQIPCSSTNAPSGTTCSAGNESVGVAFTPLGTFPQSVLACASFAHVVINGASGSVDAYFQIVETPVAAQTTSQEGKSRVSSRWTVASSSGNQPHRLCGTFTFDSPGQRALRLRFEQDVTATVNNNLIAGDANATYGQRDIHWEVYPLSYNTPAPILVGGVTSGNMSGGERVERAKLNCDSGSAITSQSGSWISSIGNVSSGFCAVTIASGVFSAAPTCTVTTNINSTSFLVSPLVHTITTTGFSVGAVFITGGSATVTATTSSDFEVQCQGPR